MSPIELVLRAVGAEQVADAFSRVAQRATEMGGDIKNAAMEAMGVSKGLDQVAKSAEDVGDALDKAGKDIEDAIKDVERESEKAKDSIKGIEDEAKSLGDALRNLGNENGFDDLTDRADKFQDRIEESKQKVSGLITTLEGVRNEGMALTAAGAGGLLLSKHLQDAASEGERAQVKMDQMLAKRGQSDQSDTMSEWAGKLADDAFLPDDDPIKEATAQLMGFGLTAQQVQGIMPGLIGQSRLYNQSLDSVAMAMGKAFASGKAGALTRIGLTLDPADIDRLNGMEKAGHSFAEQQTAMLEVINASMSKFALNMNEGLSEADKQTNRLALSMDNLQSAMGEGAIEAQSSVNSIVASILKLGEASPDVARSAGYWLTYGSYAGSAVGTLITIGSQVAITAASLKALGVTGSTVMGLIQVGALSAAGSIMVMAAAALAAVAAIALAVYSWNVNKDKILNPTSTTDDKRSDDQFEDDRLKKNTLDDARNQAAKLNPRDRYVLMRRIAKGYFDLGEADDSADAGQEANALRGRLPKNFKTVVSPEAKKLLSESFDGIDYSANRSARFNGDSFNAWAQSKAKKEQKDTSDQVGDVKAQMGAVQKAIAGGGTPASVPSVMPGDEDLSNLSIEELQMRQAQMRLKNSKNPYAAQLQYQMFLKRRAEKQGRESEREAKEQEREEEQRDRERIAEHKKQLAATNKAEREHAKEQLKEERERRQRVRAALYAGVRFDGAGGLFVPRGVDVSGIEDELKDELAKKDAHEREFGLGSYKAPKERSGGEASGRGRGRRSSGSGYSDGDDAPETYARSVPVFVRPSVSLTNDDIGMGPQEANLEPSWIRQARLERSLEKQQLEQFRQGPKTQPRRNPLSALFNVFGSLSRLVPKEQEKEAAPTVPRTTMQAPVLLRYVENGGSLFNVPGKTGRGRAGMESGADGSSERGPRTGQMSLTEKGRSQNVDGSETVQVEGTLQLKQSGCGTLQKTAMGFRTI